MASPKTPSARKVRARILQHPDIHADIWVDAHEHAGDSVKVSTLSSSVCQQEQAQDQGRSKSVTHIVTTKLMRQATLENTTPSKSKAKTKSLATQVVPAQNAKKQKVHHEEVSRSCRLS
jgi:hypothetical protein